MGFWGSALFSNDTTCDVRDIYKGFLSDQLGNEEAYEKTLAQCHEYIGDLEEPLFWYALADTQWRVGRLQPDVKEKALEWIEKGGGMELFEENPKAAAGWQKTLQKLKEKLNTPMPKEKKFPRLDFNPWNLNDVYAYQLHTEEAEKRGLAGKYMILQKMGEENHGTKTRKKVIMQIHAFDHVFDELPAVEYICKHRLLPIGENRVRNTEKPLEMNGYIYFERPTEYPEKWLTFLGNQPGPPDTYYADRIIGWRGLEYHLCYNYELWKGKVYAEIAEGVYNTSQYWDMQGCLIGLNAAE